MFEPRRTMCCFGLTTKPDVARATIQDYEYEAFPSWSAAHRGCPTRLEQLSAYMNKKDIRDPWGTAFVFTCHTVAGRARIAVASAGEDEEIGTADDIRSRW